VIPDKWYREPYTKTKKFSQRWLKAKGETMKEGKYLFDGNKLLWHMDRVHKHFKQGQRIYPLHIDIGATKMCNAKCIYCYGIFQEMSRDIIPGEVLVQLFYDAPLLGIRSLVVTGDGEPTLNPALYDACDIGTMHGLDIGIATNGIALNEKKLKRLLTTCTWLRFNLSAVDEVGYKSIHGVPEWERVQANIKMAVELKDKLKSKCTLGLQMVLIPQCLDYVIPEAKFAVDNRLDYFVIKQFSDPGCKEMTPFNLSWYDNVTVRAVLKTAESLTNFKTKVIAKWGMMHSKGKRPYDHCADCALLFQISGSSKCYPCGYLFNNEEYCYGDLKKNTLKEILDSERYWEVVKHMRYDFNVHEECKGCCRHDFTNAFIDNYLNPPDHINFI